MEPLKSGQRDWAAVGASIGVLGVLAVLVIVIGGAVIASWTHLVLAFVAIEPPRGPGTRPLVAEATATAIEVGLFAFSLASVLLAFLVDGERPRRERIEVLGIIVFCGISLAANVYAGVLAATNGQPANWRTIPTVQGAAIVLFSGTLPFLIVLALHVALALIKHWRVWTSVRLATRAEERRKAEEREEARQRRADERRKAEEARANRSPDRSPARSPNRSAGRSPQLTLVASANDSEHPGANDPAPRTNGHRSQDRSPQLALSAAAHGAERSPGGIADQIASYLEGRGPQHWGVVSQALGLGKTAIYGAAQDGRILIKNGVLSLAGPAPTTD